MSHKINLVLFDKLLFKRGRHRSILRSELLKNSKAKYLKKKKKKKKKK